MPNPSRSPLPAYREKSYVVWAVSEDRVFEAVIGDTDSLPMPYEGKKVDEANAAYPELLRLVDRMLAGEVVNEVTEFDGNTWRCEGGPRRDAKGNVIGCSGVSWLLEMDLPIVPDMPREQVWELDDDIPGGYRRGDLFFRTHGEPFAHANRAIPVDELDTMLNRHPMHLVSDSAYRHLRLLP
jgi:hypothetical protein